MTAAEIREGQHWRSKNPDRLKSTGQIVVLQIGQNGMIRIERFYRSVQRGRKDWITPKGLRSRYTLVAEQETLT